MLFFFLKQAKCSDRQWVPIFDLIHSTCRPHNRYKCKNTLNLQHSAQTLTMTAMCHAYVCGLSIIK